eukprot:s23_g19.t1
MPSETRADLMAKLIEMGETPPMHWTVMQLKARLAELKAIMKDQQPMTLKSRMAEVNKAAKKKATMVALAEKMKVAITPNMTIAQIYSLVEVAVTKEVAPSPYEKMSFGQYRDLMYIEVMENYPSYVTWAIQTVEENGDHGWRLERFAMWAKHFQMPAVIPKMPSDSSDASFSLVESDHQSEIDQLRQELAAVTKEKMELELAAGRVKSRKET